MIDSTHSSWRVSWWPSPVIISGTRRASVASSFLHVLLKQSFEKKNHKFCYSPEEICYKRQSPWGLISAVQDLSIRDVNHLPSGSPGLDLEEDSEVFKMLQENRQGRAAPRQSSSFRLLQEALEAEERGGTPAFVPSSLSPQASLGSATPPKLHTCEKCSANISNQAVRIQEGRYRHPGCYTCADCGLNLKMRGHFWVGNELYCEKHARQRYSVPGTLSSRA